MLRRSHDITLHRMMSQNYIREEVASPQQSAGQSQEDIDGGELETGLLWARKRGIRTGGSGRDTHQGLCLES